MPLVVGKHGDGRDDILVGISLNRLQVLEEDKA